MANEELNQDSFSAYLLQKIGRNWVLARRTSRIVDKYGEDVVCLSKSQYYKLEKEWEMTQPHCPTCGKLVKES